MAPGESLSLPSDHPSVLVYLAPGAVGGAAGASAASSAVKRGDAVFEPAGAGVLTNRGSTPLPLVWTEYLTAGGPETWGASGLAPSYRVLFENRYGRVYNIAMAARHSEPMHSHHDRIVICLSGAELRHEMPDGRKESSTLKTGEIAWRRGGTHIGHNLGDTDLWVIAIEPK